MSFFIVYNKLWCLSDNSTSSSLPTDKVRFILGGEENDESHKMFTELAALQCDKDGNEEWREMARWLKFEEAVEEGGDRWSKPHVGTLSLYSLFELRSSLLRGTVLLDMNASNLTQIAGELQEKFVIILFDIIYVKREKKNLMQIHFQINTLFYLGNFTNIVSSYDLFLIL